MALQMPILTPAGLQIRPNGHRMRRAVGLQIRPNPQRQIRPNGRVKPCRHILLLALYFFLKSAPSRTKRSNEVRTSGKSGTRDVNLPSETDKKASKCTLSPHQQGQNRGFATPKVPKVRTLTPKT